LITADASLDVLRIGRFAFAEDRDVYELGAFANAVLDSAGRDEHHAVLVDVQVFSPCALVTLVKRFALAQVSFIVL
jgi:hypothetical protein